MSENIFSYTLLVNSCDGFEDCWRPFFTLLERYWSKPFPKIVLNTEYKTFAYSGMNVQCSQAQIGNVKRLSWSECLSRALEKVETPLILYVQEDYFIESPVDLATVDICAQRMIDDPTIKHIGLTHFGAGSPILPDARPDLSLIGPRASYRISTQAGLWRKEALKSYILPWESGWMFELFGTIRSWKRNDLFLTLNRATTVPAINYQHTGIVKGQWSEFVPALFEKEGLDMDFSPRGFYKDNGKSFSRRLRLLFNVASNPVAALKSISAA